MQESDMEKRRTVFAIELLLDLKEVYNQLKELSIDIEKCSDTFYQEVFHRNKNDIQSDIVTYKAHIEQIKQLSKDITIRINEWYELIKNPNEVRKITFVLKFHIYKRKLNKTIKANNDAISNIMIENRFIKEKLINWEHDLEIKTIMEIKQGDDFNQYQNLISQKESLITELRYILPTLSGICPVEFNLSNVDNLIERLSKIAAA